MADKKYVNSILIKTRETSFGPILKVSIKLDEFSKFVKENKSDTGWLNLDIIQRKEPSEKGITHSVSLDDWKPDASKAKEEPVKKTAVPAKKPAPKSPEQEEDLSDIPF